MNLLTGFAGEINLRILAIWDEARKITKKSPAVLGEADEGFLFAGFSIADAFFWPVLWVRVLVFPRRALVSIC